MEASRILVLRGGALGDFIVTLPALALLRQRWPRAKIELAGNATAAQLARNRGLLDVVHSQHEARWSALFSDAPLPAPLAAWLAEFDLVINYWPDPQAGIRRRFPLREGQLFLAAEAMPASAPAAKHYCAPLRTVGLETEKFWVELGRPLPTAQRIAIHPGSGSPRKNWPQENWHTLIGHLPPPLSLILGEAEAERWIHGAATDATGASHPQELQRLLNRPLEELVAHFAECRLFLGHDSGISHLAAACGVPCVVLFGPTDPKVWSPPAPNVRVLQRGPDLNSISVEEVRRAAGAALADQT